MIVALKTSPPSRIALLVLMAFSILGSGTAFGVTKTATDVDGDATLTLAVEDPLYLNPPSTDWCSVEIEVSGDEVDLTIGDTVLLQVYEDDLTGDDLLFETTLVVSAAEASAQRLYRFLDCSTDPINVLDGAGDYAEIYAQAHVIKAECGTFCFDDQPQTDLIDVLVVEHASAVPLSATARLLNAYPNPFNPHTTMAFDLPVEQTVSLRVYDVGGQVINTLLDHETAPAGLNEVVWRGRDESGRTVPAGLYFYRLESGSYSETKRVVLLK